MRRYTAPPERGGDSPVRSQPTVMIVDDDPSICAALRRLLLVEGFDVRVFASSDELAAGRRPAGVCCMILDLHLPGRDGLAFLSSLNDAGVRIPTVFITGYGDIPTSVRAMQAGAIDFLPKPFSDDQLLSAVRRALAQDERLLVEEGAATQVRHRFNSL